MSKTGKIWAVAIGLAVIISVVFGVYQYEEKRQQQVAEARNQIDTGIWYFNQKDYETALKTLRAIPQDIVQDWRNPYYQGAALIQLKNYDEAVVALEEAWRLNQAEEDIPFALAVAYFKLGNLQLSKGYFHAVLQINPEHADAKGLMDIVASIERMQPGATGSENSPESATDSEREAENPNANSPTLTSE